MPVSGGEVVVSILANTAQFTEGIEKTKAGMVGLAAAGNRQSSWAANLDKNVGKVKSVGKASRDAASALAGAEYRLAGYAAAADLAGHASDGVHLKSKKMGIGFLKIGTDTALAGAAVFAGAQAFKHLQHELGVTGDKAFTTGGRIRNAALAITKLDIVSAVAAFDVQKLTGSVEYLQAAVNKVNKGGIRGQEGFVTHAIDSVAALVGADRVRERQLIRLKNLSSAYATEVNEKMVASLNNLTKAAIDTGSALNFGERGTEFGRGVGGITAENFNIKGGGNLEKEGHHTVIHVHGVTDPKTVAHHVSAAQKKAKKSNPRSRRGKYTDRRDT